MRFDRHVLQEELVVNGLLTYAIVVGAAVLLSRADPRARTFGVVLLGLLVAKILWRMVGEVVFAQLNASGGPDVPGNHHEALGFATVLWRFLVVQGDAAAVLLVAWAVAKRPRPRSSEPAGES